LQPIVLLLGVALLITVGCGGGGEDQQAAQPPQALVPAHMATDTANVEAVVAEEPAADAADVAATDSDQAALSTPSAGSSAAGTDSQPGQTADAATDVPVGDSQVHTGGPFSLQLGSFRKAENARDLANRIRELGYVPVIETATPGGVTYHRVFLRGLPDRPTAEQLGERLRSELKITYLIRRQN